MANAKVKLVQGVNTFDGVAGDLAISMACTITNSDGSGTTCKIVIKELSGEGGSSDEQSGTYSEGQVLASGGAGVSAAYTPDFYGGVLIEVIVDEGLVTEKRSETVFWVPYPTHPDVRVVNTPFNASVNAVNIAAQGDGHAHALDGWAHALRLASLGQFAVDGVGVAATEGPSVLNRTAAALGAQQYSPILALGGKGWGTGGSTSQDVRFGLQTRPVQGAVPTGELHFLSNIAGAGYVSRGKVDSAGKWTLPSLVAGGLTYPTSDGTPGQFLKTDGSGNLSFDTVVGGSGYDTVENVGAPVTQRSTINLTAELVASDVASKTQLALAGTLSPHTFASGTALTFPVTINKTGGGQANNSLLDFQRGGTPTGWWELDSSDNTYFIGQTSKQLLMTVWAGYSLAAGVQTSGTPTTLVVTGAAHTGMTASTEVPQVNINLSQTYTWAAGAIATQRFALFQAPTVAFASASTVTTAATVAISGAPVAGANATLTNAYALWVQAGNVRIAGDLIVDGSISGGGGGYDTVENVGTPVTQRSTINLTAELVASDVASKTQLALASTLTSKTIKGLTVAPDASTGSVSSVLSITAPNHTALTASTEFVHVNAPSATWEWATGAISTQRFWRLSAPTIAFVGGSTVTNAYTAWIAAPLAGTNATLTNASALGLSATVLATYGLEIEKNLAAAASNRYINFTRQGSTKGNVSLDANDAVVMTSGAGVYTFGVGGIFEAPVVQVTTRIDLTQPAPTDTITISNNAAGSAYMVLNGSSNDLHIGGGNNQTTHLVLYRNGKRVGINKTPSASVALDVTLPAETSGVPQLAVFTGAAHTGMTASSEATQFYVDVGQTYQWATGALTTQRFVRIAAPTLAFVASSTVTTALTAHILAPLAGTNATLTTAAALGLEASVAGTYALVINKALAATTNNKFESLQVNGVEHGYWQFDNSAAIDRIQLFAASGKMIQFGAAGTVYFTVQNNVGSTGASFSNGNVDFGGYTVRNAGAFEWGNNETGDLGTSGVGGRRVYSRYFKRPESNSVELELAATGAIFLATAQSSGTPKLLTLTGVAHTGQTQATENIQTNFNFAQTYTWANTSANHVTKQRHFYIQAPTLNFANNTGTPEFTQAATVAISGPPVMGGNAVIGTGGRWAMLVESGGILVEQLGAAWTQGLKLHTTDTPASQSGFSSPYIEYRGSGKASTTLYPQAWSTYMLSDQRVLNDVGTLYGSWIVYNEIAAEKMLELKRVGTDLMVAFCGVTPAARATWSVTNVTTDRNIDTDTVAVAELADAFGTLVNDLRNLGLVL